MGDEHLARAHRHEAGPDGNLWLTEQIADKIGRISSDGIFVGEHAVALPQRPVSNPCGTGAQVGPAGIVKGPDDAMWFTPLWGKVGRMATS